MELNIPFSLTESHKTAFVELEIAFRRRQQTFVSLTEELSRVKKSDTFGC
jgi:hypothetical protein